MILEDINIARITTENLIDKLKIGNLGNLSNSEKKAVLKTMDKSIIDGKFKSTLNSLILSFFYDTPKTLIHIRKKGTFRYSRYKNGKNLIPILVTEILKLNDSLFSFSIEDKEYLQSILNLENLHNVYKQIDKYILDEINLFESLHKDSSLIKSLLTFSDYMFLSNHIGSKETNMMNLQARSKEDISYAISYLIYFISERKPKHLKETNKVSTEFLRSSNIHKLVGFTCCVSDYKEFEVQIDHFNYKCVENGEVLNFVPPTENFEKCIRTGYIKSELQPFNDMLNSDFVKEDTKILSLEQLVDDVYKQVNFEIFEYTESNNYPRYRIKMPEPIFDYFIETYFKKDYLFLDEIAYLSHINKEQLLDIDELDSIVIRDGLSLLDIIKLRRFFSFFHILFTKKIYEIKDVSIDTLFRSLIPSIQSDQLYDYLERILPLDKVEIFLDLICWEKGLDFIFDLQYYPIILVNDNFLISSSIFQQSNFIRNIFAAEHKRNNKHILSNGVIDTLVNELSNAFTAVNINNYSQTAIPNSDLDLFAYVDDTLYVFECKHTLHPVSSFDLRTTFDYIKKAEKQLDNINLCFKEKTLLPILEEKHEIDLSSITRIVGCIVISNRLFNGNEFKYSVRNVNEIANILKRGTMKTENGLFRLWNGDTLTNNDLLDYFDRKSQVADLLMNSLTEDTLRYDIMKPPIEVKSYYLDMESANTKLKSYTDTLLKISE